MLSSNTLYGQLNKRFDRRARILARAGYTYQRIDVLGTTRAYFVKLRYGSRYDVISADLVLSAHNRVFLDQLAANRYR